MKLIIKAGATSSILQIFIRDSSSSTGGGLTGLTNSSPSLTAYYHRGTDTTATAISLASMTVGTFTSSGFKEIDATNMPGWYQFCPPDASLAAGAKSCAFHLKGATNMAPNPFEVMLVAYDPQDTVRLGLTALPNAAAAAAGGVPVLGTNATAISFTAGVTVSSASGTALTISSSGGNGSGMDVSGNGTGQGIKATGGATGRGIHALGGATSGSGFRAEGQGAAAMGIHGVGGSAATGMTLTAGATGAGLAILGGATSGDGIDITTTSGDGISVLPTAGNALVLTANGTSKHGAVITGGTAGTSDGLKAVAGTGGVPIRGNITGDITGNLSGSAGSVSGTVGSVTGNVGGNVVGTVASVVGAVGSVTGNVGGSTASVVGAVGSVTGNVGGNVTGSVGSVVGAVGSVTGNVGGNVTGTVASVVGNVGGNVTGTVASVVGNVGGNVTGSVGSVVGAVGSVIGAVGSVTAGVTVTTNNDKTGYGLSAAAVQAVWDALTSALTTAGSIGKLLVDNINATISSRLASASYTVPPTVGAIADQVWDEVLAGHLTSGTTGAALNSAGSSGDPWGTALPGVYGAGTAGKIIGDNINATVGSRATQTSVDTLAGYVDTEVAAIKAKTDQLVFTTANQVDSTAVTVSDKTGYSLASGQIFVKKNTALANVEFLMLDSAFDPAEGLTVTAQRSIDGGAFASCANSVSEVSDGIYKISLAAADLNGVTITLKFSATDARTTYLGVITQP